MLYDISQFTAAQSYDYSFLVYHIYPRSNKQSCRRILPHKWFIQQQRRKESEARRAEQQKKEDRLTYIMLGVVAVIFVIFAGFLLF